MRSSVLVIASVSLFIGCGGATGPTPGSPDAGTSGSDGGAGSDGGSADAATVDDDLPLTLSPVECQADLVALHDDATEVRKNPAVYKGEIFEVRRVPVGEREAGALLSLETERRVLVGGQPVPWFSDDYDFTFAFDQHVLAPDHGQENDPDYPIALEGLLYDGNVERRRALVRVTAAGATQPVLISGEPVSLGDVGGELAQFSDFVLAPEDDLFVLLTLKDDITTYLVRQAGPGAPLSIMLRTGTPLPTGDEDTQRFVGGFTGPMRTNAFGGVIVPVSVVDENQADTGFAYLEVDTFVGDIKCLATDEPILCGGVVVNVGATMLHFGSDGATTGAVIQRPDRSVELHYKVIGVPRVESFERGVAVQGFTMYNFKTVRACESTNSLYFVAGMSQQGRGNYDELMRIDENGTLSQVTNFGPLHEIPALKGDIPDEIRDFALGYNCDAMMYTWGRSRADSMNGYEGYWAAYAGGDVVEILDETAARADRGNGEVTDVSRSRSGLDPNADRNAVVSIGPDGEFYFINRLPDRAGELVSRYFRATEPKNRCREPVDVNSTDDDSDLAPGDGVCDTGKTVGGDPACTLRAAIEETNAAPGSDAIEVALGPGSKVTLTRPLPPITSRVTLEGGALEVDGSDLDGMAVGLDLRASDATIRNLTFRGFPSHGVRATGPVTLDGIASTHNCGWGLWLEDKARVEGTSRTSSVAYNGAANGCQAGGIYSSVPLDAGTGLRLSDVASSHNGGPGIMAQGLLRLAGEVEASDNDGAGVHLEDTVGGFLSRRLSQTFGRLTARRNRHHGVSVVRGDLELPRGHIRADDNCGFGVHVEVGKALLGSTGPRSPQLAHSFRRNGQANAAGGLAWQIDEDGAPVATPFATCAGGGVGIFGSGPDDRAGPNRVFTATIADNSGPGLATTDTLRVVDAWITGNHGPGVQFFDESGETSFDTVVVRFDQGPRSTVEHNAGPGIQVDAGSLRVRARLTVRNNAGSGIEVADGDVHLNLQPGDSFTDLRNNGAPPRPCKPWQVDLQGWTGLPEVACVRTDGASTGNGDIRALAPVVRDNVGAGFRAADPESEGKGVVSVDLGQICGNGEADVAVTFDYDQVDTTCN